MPPFKDEHILVIAPGSRTTLAQLGLPESFAPARLRFPTRMFPAESKGAWEPYKIREKKPPPRTKPVEDGENGSTLGTGTNGQAPEGGDVPMADVGQDENEKPSTDAPSKVEQEAEEAEVEDDETQYEEDPTSDEGAVYPLTAGRATDWPCFLALLSHIHNTLSPPFHTPILLIAQPAWTEQDHETVTQFFFEKFKTPAFCLMDSALAVCYAYGVPTATVIDVGFEKTDITAVSDFIAHDVGRGVAVLDCGGEAMTRRLLELLGPKGWTRDMCEQLKKSNICEILPRDVPLPGSTETERPNVSNPAAAASTSAVGSGAGQRPNAAALGEAPRGLGPDTDVGDEEEAGDLKAVDDEGVLDVAAIVTSGKTQEYLAKKEKEKAERAAARKAAAEAAAGPLKPTRLPNSKRERNTFIYEERRQGDQGDDAEEKIPEDKNPEDKNPETDMSVDAGEAKKPELAHNGATEKVDGENSAADGPAEATESQATGDDEAARRQQERAARKEERRRNRQTATGDPSLARREVEVGVERLMATSGGSLEKLADAVHRTVLSVQEVGKRGELWDSLIVVGNGSKVRGFKDGLVSAITAKYLISPSSATIFTSELPSNLSTPLATGANTPQPQLGPPGGGSHVNPLLLAATTASHPALNPSPAGHASSSVAAAAVSGHTTHSSHGQTPTSVKLVKMPEYFSEWKDVGFEEAAFLGAQVAAKVVFVVDQGLSKGFMTRVEYNELGPQGIHETML